MSPGPMQGLHIDLLDRFDVDKAHRWSRYGLGNRLGIQCIVLVGLQIWLHKLGGDDPDRVAKRADGSCQPLRAGTRFHPDDGGFGKPEKLQ